MSAVRRPSDTIYFTLIKDNVHTHTHIPVKPHASANRKVLQDMRKKSAVSSRGKQCSLVNFVT